MANILDKQYTDLLQDILDNGVKKQTRNGEVLSVFGRQIRHKMSDGFPLLTTKKLHWKSIVGELLWFLRGDTNIKWLVDNGISIWTGDAYKRYTNHFIGHEDIPTKEWFENEIKTNDEFAKKWGELGSIYGKQWREWKQFIPYDVTSENCKVAVKITDQIANLINELKTNPDSRRLLVSAWNPAELDTVVLPPCHYGFQVYTREIDVNDELNLIGKIVNYKGSVYRIKCIPPVGLPFIIIDTENGDLIIREEWLDSPIVMDENIPTRAISLMWNQRSVDTFLGLPFNIASYGLLLEIIAKVVNMVPDELVGNLGDTHLYSNHIEQAKEQIGRELSDEERYNIWFTNNYETGMERFFDSNNLPDFEDSYYEPTPKRTREPYPLPTLNINTEFWPYEGGECGIGPLDATSVIKAFSDDNFCRCLLEEDIQLGNYQSHPSIKAPLSN